MKNDLLLLLSEREVNAVSTKELTAVTGLSAREVTRCVNKLRNRGEVILSNRCGFYLPGSNGEVEKLVKTMRSRQKEIARATKSAVDFLKNGGVADG